MTITLPLLPGEEARLADAAEAKGITTEALLREAVEKLLIALGRGAAPGTDARPIWQVVLENSKDVPDEEFARLPKDGSTQHDHYLYGHPKRQM